MELKLTNENIINNEILYNNSIEEPIELECLLPDYCPSIFKILKTKIKCSILSKKISGNKLIVDGITCVNTIYVAENTNEIKNNIQKISFSRTVEMSRECISPMIMISASCDYINNRVVNPRKLDIRGAINLKIKVIGKKDTSIVSSVCGKGIQMKNKIICIGNNHKCEEKAFKIKDEIILDKKIDMEECFLYTETDVYVTDYKIIANKVIVKGELIVKTMYKQKLGEYSCIIKKVPVSQIIDVLGIDSDYNCYINFESTTIDISYIKSDDCSKLECVFGIYMKCHASHKKEIKILQDAYSTKYKIELEKKEIESQYISCIIDKNICSKVDSGIDIDTEDIYSIEEVFCEFSPTNMDSIDGEIIIKGDLSISIICLDIDKIPVIIEKKVEINLNTGIMCEKDNINIDISVCILDCKTNLLGNIIEICYEINLSGAVYQSVIETCISNIEIDEEDKKDCNNKHSISIYYGEEGEDIWDIAKEYNTSIDSIIAENDIEQNIIKERKMILIPIIQ
ncbi:MAG: DUF3794 domain-containing protein [Oscillospiraceae bacterium]|nr:DUF3794 domain-containing protein [Oscillospiraceae bacterium]